MKKNYITTLFLIIAIVIIIIMGCYIMKLTGKNDISTEKIIENNAYLNNSDLTAHENYSENTQHNKDYEDTSKKSVVEKNSNNIVGKWNTYRISDVNTTESFDNLRDFFGTSYMQYGSYLELKENGTFIDNIRPVQTSEVATEGTYTVYNGYNKPGDCYIELKYSDGTVKMFQKVYYTEERSEALVFSDEQFQYDLKR